MDDKDFLIFAGPHGTLNKDGKYFSVPKDIDDMFDKFQRENSSKITIYFHGGLVDEENGKQSAERIAIPILAANNAPVCFVWKTGFLETITSSLNSISGTTLFKRLSIDIARLAAKHLGFGLVEGRGPGGMPSEEEVALQLSKNKPFDNYSPKNLPMSRGGATSIDDLPEDEMTLELMITPNAQHLVQNDELLVIAVESQEISITSGRDAGSRGIFSIVKIIKNVVEITIRIIKRFKQKRDHDFYPTLVEEILRQFYIAELGAVIWNEMKVKADEMWHDNAGLSGLDLHTGRYFLDKLAKYVAHNPDTKINLIGHSAGTIVICHMLKAIKQAGYGIKFNNIIFWAPACRVDIFNEQIVQAPHLYNGFRCFTMHDLNEKDDVLVPAVYTHSLLYLISGILEDGGHGFDEYIGGMERHIGGNYPYDTEPALLEAHNFIYAAGSNRLVLSPTGLNAPAGFSTNALHHGDFHDDPTTINSMKHLIS